MSCSIVSSQTGSLREWFCNRVFVACVFFAKVSVDTWMHESGAWRWLLVV